MPSGSVLPSCISSGGRVGRGSSQSYCIFMQGDGKEESSRRLEVLNRSNDGFYIAEEDLKQRGPGDLFGLRQSGMAEFQIADIYQDASVLKEGQPGGRGCDRPGSGSGTPGKPGA